MARPDEREVVEAQIAAYINPVIADPRHDNRPLTVAALVALHGRSPNTWRRYGATEALKRAKGLRVSARGGATRKHKHPSAALAEARADAAHWQRMYRELLVNWTIVEGYFLNHRSVNLDQVVARGFRRLDRDRPA